MPPVLEWLIPAALVVFFLLTLAALGGLSKKVDEKFNLLVLLVTLKSNSPAPASRQCEVCDTLLEKFAVELKQDDTPEDEDDD